MSLDTSTSKQPSPRPRTVCLNYEVGALGTTVEGPDDELWALLRRMHEATLKSGASSVITNVRIAQQAEDDGPQIEKTGCAISTWRMRRFLLPWRRCCHSYCFGKS